MNNTNIPTDVAEKQSELSKFKKKSKKLNRIRTASLSIAALSACAAVYAGASETKKDDFLIPVGYATTLMAAGIAGTTQKKKETIDAKLGKPSKTWSFIKKISFFSAIAGFIGTIVSYMTEDKGDNKIIPWTAPLSVFSAFLYGYAYQKNKEALKNKTPEKSDTPKQKTTYQAKTLSQNSILWDIKTNMPLDKNLARTLEEKSLSLNPMKIVHSTLPLFKKFNKVHQRS
ncbi:MAG: hypothetical protein J6V53_03735 [Alphaproteobacteria bacterium]|nr:hypothetical protein [Alphaproteobacteria bacterium]